MTILFEPNPQQDPSKAPGTPDRTAPSSPASVQPAAQRAPGYYLKSALIIGVCFAGVILLFFILLQAIGYPVEWPGVLAAAALAGLAIVTWLAWRWINNNIERPWQREDLEMETLIQLLQAGTGSGIYEHTPGAADQLASLATPAPESGAALRLAGYEILQFHYGENKRATRPECVAAGICNTAEWNALNAVFKAIGLKQDRSWIEPDYTAALAKFKSASFDHAGAYCVANGQIVRFDREAESV